MSDKNNEVEDMKGEDWEAVESVLRETEKDPENVGDSARMDEADTIADAEIDTGKGNRKFVPWVVALVIIGVAALAAVLLIGFTRSGATEIEANAETEADSHSNEGGVREVKLDPESLNSAKIEIEGVTVRTAVALLKTTGTIENDPQRMQNVTPLVGGRIERMNVAVGDFVSRGDLLAVIASPQVAQMHGKMHEAETKLEIAERNLERVQKAENRVAVLQAKAKLDEAEATLKRIRRLIELEAGAGKDLIAAETSYKTAKADYDFQRNISLNKEIQEARAEVETSRADLRHIRDEMRSLGVKINSHKTDNQDRNTSLVYIHAPASGMVTERPVNPGAGISAGTTLFVLSNLSSVYIIANVPEAQMPQIRIGTAAAVTSPALSNTTINARVTYIDPNLNEDTRTGKVRLEVPNPGGKLRAGMFVNVGFYTAAKSTDGEQELVVPSEAVQRIDEETVVFIPKENEPGAFEVREIKVGGEYENYTTVTTGLKAGDKVVTKGSFTLKTALKKDEFGEDDH
ncbi:MAG: efflux RND transporter periplasmic adaptor subunit [Acidobacteria bacterium]|nr:MAG: efflux RND transporter periplasmic adaptor subunit [Acidobacteriota bacterium]REJ98239.1 MAG: efflux RND transporter periplasmic adaptor subunit [Acidobacteriota bacterium]REK16983.1 MAG: efflux RND transporter periplasmic adaptor subunit [Acidobacteriota bacterium]REK42893.1 MAG: efflux RND transporter periplasmic adaptor subunit [Acidobacteriota bacterium]